MRFKSVINSAGFSRISVAEQTEEQVETMMSGRGQGVAGAGSKELD